MTVDLSRLKTTLPENGTIEHITDGRQHAFLFKVKYPTLKEMYPESWVKYFEKIKKEQRKIIGAGNILELYTFIEGSVWKIYLKQISNIVIIKS